MHIDNSRHANNGYEEVKRRGNKKRREKKRNKEKRARLEQDYSREVHHKF